MSSQPWVLEGLVQVAALILILLPKKLTNTPTSLAQFSYYPTYPTKVGPSVAGLVAAVLLVMALVSWVPQVIKHRQTLSLTAAEFQRPAQTRIIRRAGEAGSNIVTNAQQHFSEANFQRHLEIRAKAIKRRQALSIFLLTAMVALGALSYFRFLSWYWALIPAGLLVAVLALGANAAKVARQVDADFAAQRGAMSANSAGAGNSSHVLLATPATNVGNGVGGITRSVVSLPKMGLQIAPAGFTPARPPKQTATTERIPDAEMAEIVAQHLEDDLPDSNIEPETRWSLGTPAANGRSEQAPKVLVETAIAESIALAQDIGLAGGDGEQVSEAIASQEPQLDSGPNAEVLAFPAPPERQSTDTLGLSLDEILARRRAVS